jgi:hypothetical protein
MEVRYYNFLNDNGIQFVAESKSEFAFELNKLNYETEFELVLLKENIAIALIKYVHGYRGIFYETDEKKETRTGFKINNIEQLKQYSLEFFNSTSESFKSYIKSIEEDEVKKEKEKYEKWKKEYELEKKEPNFNNYISLAITLLILVLIYLTYSLIF